MMQEDQEVFDFQGKYLIAILLVFFPTKLTFGLNICQYVGLILQFFPMLALIYSQTCAQRPPLGPEKSGRFAFSLKKISGK